MQTPPLTARELVDVVLLACGFKEEVVKKLHGGHAFAAAQVNHLGIFPHSIYHLVAFVKLQSLLREIAETHGFAHREAALVGLHQSQQHLDEGAFARAIAAHNAHLLVAAE